MLIRRRSPAYCLGAVRGPWAPAQRRNMPIRQVSSATFGAELEIVGSSMKSERMGAVVTHALGALYPEPVDYSYDTMIRQRRGQLYDVYDHKSRPWRIKRDGKYDLELTTPPMAGKEDLELLQHTARELRHAGARVGPGRGLHFHVNGGGFIRDDNDRFDCGNLASLLGLFLKYQMPLYVGFQVYTSRRKFCMPLERGMIEELRRAEPQKSSELFTVWYNYPGWERYMGLNIRSLWDHATVEGRMFNATFDPVMIGAAHGVMTGIADKVLEESKKPAAERMRFDDPLIELPKDNAAASLREFGELVKLDEVSIERLVRNAKASEPEGYVPPRLGQ